MDFRPTSKKQPCIICGNTTGHCKTKDGDRGDTLIYCHNHEINPGEAIAGHQWLKAAGGWGIFGPAQTKAAIAPKQRREYQYFDVGGNPLIRVVRVDDGQGGKKIWQEYHDGSSYSAKAPQPIRNSAKAAVMPYRYADCKSVADAGEAIYWVEGEKCADLLWDLGLPATTTIGGSDGYKRYGDYSRAFEGCQLVICPDRDQSGLKYTEAIAADYPQAQWLYAPPGREWDNLPKSGGLDVADWIANGADKTAIVAAVGGRRVGLQATNNATNNVVSIRNGAPVLPVDSLDAEIQKLLDRNLAGAKLQAEKIRLRQSSALTDREFSLLWDAVEKDYEAGTETNTREIERLLAAKRSSLKLLGIVPHQISARLGELAQMMSLREEVFLVSLLSTLGTLAQNGTSLILHQGMGFEVAPNLYGAIVSPPSQRKSPVISAIATKPLKRLEKEAKETYKQELKDWQRRQAQAKADGEEFDEPEPEPEVYFFTKASGEAILQQANRCPHRGLLNLSDELAGLFRSKNQYRGGRGSDTEDMLSYYDATGGKTLRADGVRNDVDSLNYGILGGIQPTVLQEFLGSCEDSNGNWARFIFVNQPIAAASWPKGDFDNWDLTTMLADYYRRIASYAPDRYKLSSAASVRFGELYDDLEQRRVRENNPALQAMIGKSAGRIGKIALALHLLDAAAAGEAYPSLEISLETIDRAALVAEFAIEQIEAIYADADTSSDNPTLTRIVELSQRKGTITARDAAQALPKSNRPAAATIRRYFQDLAEQGYGEISGEGKSINFTAKPEQEAEPETELATVAALKPGDKVSQTSEATEYSQAPPEPLTIARIDLDNDSQRFFATVVDSAGTNHAIWINHLVPA